MFAVERHRGAWILMRVQARKDILESKSFLLFLSELLLGYGALLLEGPKITRRPLIPFRGASAVRALSGISSASHLPAKLCEGLGPLRGHSDFALKAESGDS